jgi:ubiquinone/menaquinone biosynthesis C-methylase UbiE
MFATPLIDLGARDPRFAGILAPADSVDSAKAGVTAQFLEHADDYHRRYLAVDYWRFLVDGALAKAGITAAPATILDIGSGSGNSVIPLGARFPAARILATDISPQLLAILRDFLSTRGEGNPGRHTLVCVDAMRARYREGFADLAVGAAILHHLVDPPAALAACQRALKPGSWALFFEPFEPGNVLVRMVYERLLAQASASERQTPGMQLVARMVEDYRVRARPRSDPVFERLDDKWMFTRGYFERLRETQGWAELIVQPLNVSATFLRTQTEVHLRLGAELEPSTLPAWAWSVIDEIDASVSDDLRREWAPEAAVLLRKAPKANEAHA